MLNPTLFVVMGKWYLHQKQMHMINKQVIIFSHDESSIFHDHMTMCLLHFPNPGKA
jgi:hypothetical protein